MIPVDEEDDVSHIQVAIRIRPDNSSHSVLHAHSNPPSIHIGSPPSKSFFFDLTFPPSTSQKNLYEDAVKPLVQQCCQGYNATVLAYGQTGSGKTHTMLGPTVAMESNETDEDNPIKYCSSTIMGMDLSQAGVIPRAIRDLFHTLEQLKQQQQQQQQQHKSNNTSTMKEQYTFEIRLQFLELYGETIYDLLSSSKKNRLVIRDGTHTLEPEVIGASEVTVTSPEEALFYMSRGMIRRITGATAMNSESSRSHAIFTVIVEQHTSVLWDQNSDDNTDTNSETDDNRSTGKGAIHSSEVEIKRSKFHFVDLAGSERQKKSLATGLRLKEGIEINKGLLVLGNVISALGDPTRRGQHVPYRDSKLTRLLKGSLGGNHKTLMIACVSPSERNIEESINSLRYANRAKNIQNKAVLNIDASTGSELVKELKQRVKELARALLVYVAAEENDNSETNLDPRKAFTVSELKRLSKGEEIDRKSKNSDTNKVNTICSNGSSEDTTFSTAASESTAFTAVGGLKSELDDLKSTTEYLQNELKIKSETLFAAKAEIEYYRLQTSDDLSSDQDEKTAAEKSNDIKTLYLAKMQDYEREIESLREELRYVKAQNTYRMIPDSNSTADSGDAIYPELSKVITDKQSPSYANEEDEEDVEISALTSKYTKIVLKTIALENDYDDVNSDTKSSSEFAPIKEADESEKFATHQAKLDEQVILLSKGISAKEDLIQQLEKSQQKYLKMKAFYEEKLKKMSLKLSVQEAEKTSLETELQKYSKNSKMYLDVEEALAKKEKYISKIKKRQVEMLSLTSVASRNEAVISDLTNQISKMKIQRDDLQKQLLNDRKNYNSALRQLERRSLAQTQDIGKIREQLDTTLAQKHRVEEIARSRGEEIVKLRDQYQNAEKRLRMQTLKRGMLERAGVDQIMVGRYGRKTLSSKPTSNHATLNQFDFSSNDINKMRETLHKYITEISKMESTADVLAKEWEDHFELCTRKASASKDGDRDEMEIKDEIESLDFQIQYKESRIRKLAARLGNSNIEDGRIGKVPSGDDFVDNLINKVFKSAPHLSVLQLAVKVLFGIIVRERRRVTSLATIASNLDQLSTEASNRASTSETALKSLVEEHKNERVTLIQNHQEKILALMEMIQDDDFHSRNSKIDRQQPISLDLRLANERIEILEDQLAEMEDERAIKESIQLREQDLVCELEKISGERKELLKKVDVLKGVLVKIKEQVSCAESDQQVPTKKLLMFIQDSLNQISVRDMNENNAHIAKFRHMHECDEEDTDNEGDSPDWASSIMQDLAIIAAGEVPASMQPGAKAGSVVYRLPSEEKFMPSTPQNDRKQDRKLSFSPKRRSLPDRISNIIKDGPSRLPKDPSLSSFDEESVGPRSVSSARGSKGSQKSEFVGKDVFERLQKKHTNSFTNRNSDGFSKRS
jgi:hypothetical protein